ncbi:MAG: hypothetical protein K8H88_26170, partial [Sandaracinaceae bacterium]|nr:hypothetical protein [Sandaracinaceae bacterium]
MARADEHTQASARFAEGWTARCKLARDRALVADMTLEARPVLESLLEARRFCPELEPSRPELSEPLALASLLGRRAANLGGTVGGVLELGPLLADSIGGGPPALVESLRALTVEGFVSAREETLAELADRRAAEATVCFLLAPRVMWVALAGAQSGDALEPVLEQIGRTMLERDVRACVVDVSALRRLDRDVVARALGLHATAQMLGASAIFVGISETWRDLAEQAGTSLADVRHAPDPVSAARDALASCGLELRTLSPLAS